MAKDKSAQLPKAIAPLIGRWVAADPWATDVSLILSRRSGKLNVRAVDQSDGEEAEVMGLKITKDTVTFAAYWASGQLTKYRLRAISAGLEAVFTVTATTTFQRVTRKG
jgi:hypothetical protein